MTAHEATIEPHAGTPGDICGRCLAGPVVARWKRHGWWINLCDRCLSMALTEVACSK
jgi:hypothetical protein